MALAPLLVWFRQDLRLVDNPALAEAAAAGRAVVPVYILDEAGEGAWAPGAASRWWLHHSLASLAKDLAARGSRLILRRGPSAKVLETLIAETGAEGVHWNRRYEPASVARDAVIKKSLEAQARIAKSFNASLLFEPWTIRNKAGEPYRVFTQFWKTCLSSDEPPLPVKAPLRLAAPSAWPKSETLESWKLLPAKPDWAAGFRESWTPGEAGANARLDRFLDRAVETYKTDRNRPDMEATSRLSAHLHFGEIGPRQCFHAARACAGGTTGAEHFLSELGWREFSAHLLFQRPDLPELALRADFRAFPWADDAKKLRAWQKGRTGYPIVDAGMRELWHTGWMHNRVRMIVASFLVKHLLLPWQRGQEWFWDTLVDADLANNAASWQWVAGCGADAAPYFRIFNPILQGAKFDPDGAYTRKYVPELAGLPTEHLFAPWEAPDAVLRAAGVTLGKSYPEPLVEHGAARARALAAFQSLRAAA
ncbi:MAG: deoxyribodipyrimidine photo-lyase [Proteobacteria bacterium]|nr:deoxyribodipyrimidine photo-lyase [Pseudomonadota bacterium]